MAASVGICPADLKRDILKRLPGAWNVLVLHADPSDPAATAAIIGACIGSVFQVVPGTDGMTVGELAVSLAPTEFVACVDGWREFLPRLQLMILEWRNTVDARAALLTAGVGLKRAAAPKGLADVIKVNFGGA